MSEGSWHPNCLCVRSSTITVTTDQAEGAFGRRLADHTLGISIYDWGLKEDGFRDAVHGTRLASVLRADASCYIKPMSVALVDTLHVHKMAKPCSSVEHRSQHHPLIRCCCLHISLLQLTLWIVGKWCKLMLHGPMPRPDHLILME